MTTTSAPSLRRILVATDRSASADAAVRWAANMAEAQAADLVVVQIVIPPLSTNGNKPDVPQETLDDAQAGLTKFAREIAGVRGHARVIVDDDPSHGILRAIEEEGADAVVVGNLGMSGRKEFLLGNVPNRVSHSARCTVIIVNTAAAVTIPVVEPASGGTVERRLLRRAWRLGRIMTRAGMREVLTRPANDEEALRERAVRLREALDQSGPTFAKLGQILSTRPDLIPPAVLEELQTLQERVTPLSQAEVVSAMEKELRVPWEDVFASIDPEPLAAGTIAQVHRATLETGERVVVKVQRPTAEQDIMDDLGLLQMFVQKAGDRPAFKRVFDLPAIIQHLSDSLRRELDFRQEASNIRRMRQVLAPYHRLAVPDVFDAYSTSRLLVMQEVQGGPVTSAPEGPERKEAARELLESFYSQILSEGFFHADPHPGNLKWWDGKIYFLDLGMVGQVEPSIRELMLLLLLAFAQEDASFLSEVVLMLASGGDAKAGDDVDVSSFRDEVGRMVQKYRRLSLRELQLGPMLQEITEIGVRHHVPVPASLMLSGKAFAQMQLVAADLDPTLDPFTVAGSFVMRHTLGRVTAIADPRRIMYETQKTWTRVMRFIEAIEGLTGARPGGNLQVNFRGTEHLEETIGRSARQLSLALAISASIVGTAMSANSERVPKWLPATLGGTASALTGMLMLEMRRKPKK
ncbi:MAG TPA: AarF/UbiB family protein [Dehalococcoidia bacterium]|jgi:predicted unusual protein kinase regulating ubiquinone biosynthesis (AarF/ABC1/UbiB family)/nucleotide-binding universal stress UspA family protein